MGIPEKGAELRWFASSLIKLNKILALTIKAVSTTFRKCQVKLS